MNGPFESAAGNAAKARAPVEALDRERAILIRLIEHLEAGNPGAVTSPGLTVGCTTPPDTPPEVTMPVTNPFRRVRTQVWQLLRQSGVRSQEAE